MVERIVYIKPEQSTKVSHTRILLSDITKVYANEDKLAKEVGAIVVGTVKKEQKQKLTFSVMKLVRLIMEQCPGVQVINLGEKDFIVEYQPPETPKRFLELLKTVAVCLIVFAGSAFTIMTFNEDASVQEVFQAVYQRVLGEQASGGNGWLELSYSIGLPIGIILFFDHFSVAKLSSDPTPLQVQMRLYEKDTNQAIIENAGRNQEKQE